MKVSFFLLSSLMTVSAIAAPVLYEISFTGGSPAPTLGSFQYDAAVPSFSNFIVVWNGITFDLTASANAPLIGGACAGGPAGAFALLSDGSGCAAPAAWIAGDNGTVDAVLSFRQDPPGADFRRVFGLGATPSDGSFRTAVTGGFTIQSVPEPSTMATVALAGGVILACRRRRNR